jgi:hypothetical protein
MKDLKIEDNKGFYWDGAEYREIDKINKKDILALLNRAETEKWEMDPYDESRLPNKAHQIIYENLHSKFEQFLGDKTQFTKEAESLYKDAVDKYTAQPDTDEEDEADDSDKETDPDDIPF